ncbi:HAD family hydrolase [Winogradskyella alexanderae]|uniref:HAD family phosphatase n=1 Tax=Winogradskyella alexanderae TaxID=2877123 RepID=A0ABS7XW53_9FLAO|nr:HAD family phosphatase [Winogradskyella alexanderae]MCA0133061.1 HAD family phosphatase [Winogradskyella alexanderae]
MIDTLIFDFGDVFINLDKQGAMQNALDLFKLNAFEEDMLLANKNFELGKIATNDFIGFYISKFPYLETTDIVNAWNYILKDFPFYRFEFIQSLSRTKRFKLILLSNTNELHIDWIKNKVDFFEEFKTCFDQFYLSHEIRMRKPDTEIFDFVLRDNQLTPNNCLFIDDTAENTKTASKLGIHTWNIDETREDIVDLFKIKKHLF